MDLPDSTYRRLFALSLELLCIVGGDECFKRVNPAFERILGYDEAELVDQPFVSYVHPDDRAATLAEIEKLSMGTPTICFESRYRCKNGTYRWLAWTKYPSPDEGLTYAVARDVTDAKREAEERQNLTAEIERERATLASVTASMGDGLMLVDAQYRVWYCNARASELLARQIGAGERMDVLLHTLAPSLVDAEAARHAWHSALADPASRPSFEIGLASPARRDLLILLFPVAEGTGADHGYGVLLRDVTVERDLLRAKDELVAVVSHELRTPLTSLVGFAELLLARDFGQTERREFLTIALAEGRRLTALIDDFLDLQRIEAGRQTFNRVPTDLGALLARAVLLSGDDPERPIVVDIPEGRVLVQADPDAIQQVLANLLSNARKFSPTGGEVRVAAREADGVAEVSVSDRGLGLPTDALPRLFEKFFRIDNSDHREIKGTGLGLAICQTIVVAHGGRIWAESAGLGQGARFYFTLPLAKEDPGAGDVLVVDAAARVRRLLAAQARGRELVDRRGGEHGEGTGADRRDPSAHGHARPIAFQPPGEGLAAASTRGGRVPGPDRHGAGGVYDASALETGRTLGRIAR